MLRLVPTHLETRPCTVADTAGGGPRTWRPARVTCEECAPAASWLGHHVGGAAFLVFLAACVFVLCLL